MSADGFSLLWSRILDSSIWDQSAATRVVWITLLAMKDKQGVVRSTLNGLVRNANVTKEECEAALQIFLAPDPESSSKNDEGRRLREIEGGWFVINHDKYQYSSEERREYWRRVKAEQRKKDEARKRREDREKGLPVDGEPIYVKARKPAVGEGLAMRAAERGEDVGEVADRVNDEMQANRGLSATNGENPQFLPANCEDYDPSV